MTSTGGSVEQDDPRKCRPMEPESDALSLIRTTFADQRALVERAYRQSRSFRDLCRDYRRCLAALQRWDEHQEKEKAARRKEYTELLEELSEEIRASLDAPDELDDIGNGASRLLDPGHQNAKKRKEKS